MAREPRKDARSRGRSRKVTLVDVAREASCSVSLASIVMRDAAGASQETRRRVKAVAARLGYRPDQRVTTTVLGCLPDVAESVGVRAPAVIVLGDVVTVSPAWRDRVVPGERPPSAITPTGTTETSHETDRTGS